MDELIIDELQIDNVSIIRNKEHVYRKFGNYYEIYVARKGVIHTVLIDSDNFLEIIKAKWNIDAYGYARNLKGKLMHRLIMLPIVESPIYDHINMNKLDNRKSNLRPCTESQNRCNAGLSSRNKTGVKGIFWTERLRKWRVLIRFDKKQKHIGYFTDKEDAIKAYDEAAKMYYKEFARTNEELKQHQLNL